MTFKALNTLLKTTGFKVSYDKAPPETKPPYIVYYQTGISTIDADDKHYIKNKIVSVYLYTNGKDEASENTLEQVFENAEIMYDYSDNGIIEKNIREIEYEIEI